MSPPDGVSLRPTVDLLLRVANRSGYVDGYGVGFKTCLAVIAQACADGGADAAMASVREGLEQADGFVMAEMERFDVLDFSQGPGE